MILLVGDVDTACAHAIAGQRLFPSTPSEGALAVLITKDIYDAIQPLGSLDAWWNSGYDITLDIKLLIVS